MLDNIIQLTKYDLRSTKKEFFGIFIAIGGVAIIGIGLFLYANFFIPDFFTYNSQTTEGTFGVLFMLYVILALALMVAGTVIAFLAIVNLYNRKIYGAEGYLTNVLPVKPFEIVIGKLTACSVWIVGIFFAFLMATAVSVAIMSVSVDEFQAIPDGINQLLIGLHSLGISNASIVGLVIVFVLSMFFQSINEVMRIFLAISIANLREFKKHKVLAGIIAYIVMGMMESTVVTAFFSLATKISGLSIDNQMGLNTIYDLNGGMPVFYIVLALTIFANLVLLAVKFFFNNSIMKNQLELD
ncbi:MAG: hypothetical protein ACRCUS_10135 [Anaerovoracaceae bacterium]